MTKDGKMFSTDLPESMKSPPKDPPVNTYFFGDDTTALDNNTPIVEVLSGMSEIKGELRRETERMNSKMGVVEAQMRLVLKLLRGQNKLNIDPEIGLQLNELMSSGEDIDEDDGEWFIADSKGWKNVKRSDNSPANKTVEKKETSDTVIALAPVPKLVKEKTQSVSKKREKNKSHKNKKQDLPEEKEKEKEREKEKVSSKRQEKCDVPLKRQEKCDGSNTENDKSCDKQTLDDMDGIETIKL